MRQFTAFIAISAIAFVLISCGQKKEMSIEDFAKIDLEMISTDQKPESKEVVAKKYGYTLKQYQEFADKVDRDTKLQEKLGEIRLGDMKNMK
ncbi:MAG: hypothetical protein MUD12_14735 [Spirochaetes bacterium]|nr:hypothetical protein [Spirochaetota bacterium]